MAISILPAAAVGTACGPYIQVKYYEDSPDYFEISNQSGEGWTLSSLKIDLTPSVGKLIFDTIPGGYGSASPFPFQPDTGNVRLTGFSDIADGGHELVLEFADFVPGESFAFIVDVDDQLEQSEFGQAYVSDGEMTNAGITATFQGPTGKFHKSEGRFDSESRAVIGTKGCA